LAGLLSAPLPACGLSLRAPTASLTPPRIAPIPVAPPRIPSLPVAPPRLPPVPVAPPRVPIAPPRIPVAPPRIPIAPPRVPVTLPHVPTAPPRIPISPPRVPVTPPRVPATPRRIPTTTAPRPAIPVLTPSHVRTPTVPPTSGSPAARTQPSRVGTRSRSVSSPAQSTATGARPTSAVASAGSSWAALLSGYGPGRGTARSIAAPGVARHTRAGARESVLAATVRRLQGCLGNLPTRLRLVLELRTGVGAPHALDPAAVAKRLGIPVRQVSRLERQALGALRRTALTHSCEPPVSQAPSSLLTFGFGIAVVGGGRAAGGVEAARYAQSPALESAGSSAKPASPSDLSLGVSISPTHGASVPAVASVLAGALLVALLCADQLGFGPRHAGWRRRWMHLPWKGRGGQL
jgi:Sigma-70, region 4